MQKGRSYTVIDGIRGKGCFVGMSLSAGMNGHNTCWVEGEAKMYIDGDRYFKVNSPTHNLVRAHAQMQLLRDIEAKEEDMYRVLFDIIREGA